MPCTILIADDSYVDRSIIRMIIANNIQDATIIELDCGALVLSTILEKEVDVCILDLSLPDFSGVEILRKIKQCQRCQDVPIIVYSGNSDSGMIGQVLQLGAYDYFLKPLTELDMKVSLPNKVKNAIELQKRTKHIVHLSQTDTLTGLYNRQYFKRLLEQIQDVGTQQLSLMMFDINGLKIVNDAYGSDVGDSYLKQLSAAITAEVYDDGIAARWGGDEFVVMLPNLDREDCERMAQQVAKTFASYEVNGLSLSVAYGLHTACDREQESWQRILTMAEDLMHRAKILEDISIRSNLIGTIIKTLHEKNPREEAHSQRVSDLCEQLGIAMAMSDKEVHELKVVGLLHDIGKIAIDESILNKPGHLSHEEWLEMKRHPEIGYRLLSSTKDLKAYARMVLCHHERIDGKGYPNGYMGDEIPVQSKILSISDSFDAMTCERSYKQPMSEREACKELIQHSDKQFDAALVRLFIEKVIGHAFEALAVEVARERQWVQSI